MTTQSNNPVRDGDTIVVWFSCGAASAVAAKMTVDKYGDRCKVVVVNNPVAEEHEDNRRFLKDVERWIGVPIEEARSKRFPDASCDTVWRYFKYMGGNAGAPCTLWLKKRARQDWENRNHHDWMVLGFCLEERGRHDRFVKNERSNVLPVLIDGLITKERCFRIVQDAGIDLPEIYRLGYPNANCIGCVKATSPTYWNHVRRMHPEVFALRAKLSREVGARLVRYKGKRMFLDELPENATGRPIKGMQFECGIFCEERK